MAQDKEEFKLKLDTHGAFAKRVEMLRTQWAVPAPSLSPSASFISYIYRFPFVPFCFTDSSMIVVSPL